MKKQLILFLCLSFIIHTLYSNPGSSTSVIGEHYKTFNAKKHSQTAFTSTFSQSKVDRSRAFQAAKDLGKGICYQENFVYWWDKNPDLTIFRDIAAKGFKHIRMVGGRINTSDYTLDSELAEDVIQTVDSAMAAGLKVVLCGSGYYEMMQDPDGHAEMIYAYWRQMAPMLKDRNENLMFELTNEPRFNMTPEKWNEIFPNIINIIRESNPDRMLIVQPANYTFIDAATQLVLPDDPNLIMCFHNYDPGTVIGEVSDGQIGTNDHYEIQHIRSIVEVYKELGDSLNVPVWYGEGGAHKWAGDDTRSNWAQTFANVCKNNDIGMAYFDYASDDNNGTGMKNRDFNTWNNKLVNAFFAPDVPQETNNHSILWHQSFTSEMGNCGVYTTKPEEEVKYGFKNGELYVTTTTPTSNMSDIQLTIPPFTFEKGHYYAIDFTGHTSKGFTAFSLNCASLGTAGAFTPTEREYSRVFWMTEPTSEIYMNVPLGNLTDTVFIKDISIVEIHPVLGESIEIAAPSDQITEPKDSMQLSVTILPANASEKTAHWSVIEGNDFAKISREGLLVARGNGTVTVKAVTRDGTNLSVTKTFTITNQPMANVTFRVDMGGAEVTKCVSIIGSWDNWSTSFPLTLKQNIYSGTKQFYKGDTIEYKFVNGDVNDADFYEYLSGNCTPEGRDTRWLVVPDKDTVLSTACFNSCELCLTDNVEIPPLQSISLYPNPGDKQITIKGLPSTKTEIEIVTLEGKTCIRKIITQKIYANIDISQLKPGIYILSAKTDDEITTMKFVKL